MSDPTESTPSPFSANHVVCGEISFQEPNDIPSILDKLQMPPFNRPFLVRANHRDAPIGFLQIGIKASDVEIAKQKLAQIVSRRGLPRVFRRHYLPVIQGIILPGFWPLDARWYIEGLELVRNPYIKLR